jgi:predicted phage terminase large subunit-like protein
MSARIASTPWEQLKIDRNAAHEDLYFYSRYMLAKRKGVKWVRAPHHPCVCHALERVLRGECKRLIITIPPRYSKTELVSVGFVTWALGLFPDSEFILTSFSSELASTNSWYARDAVMNEAYGQLFPGVVLDSSSTAKDHWRTTKGGIVYAKGAQGTITGFGAGKLRDSFGGALIIDDPHKPDEAESDVVRKGVITWYQNTVGSRLNSPNTPIILIMQRLHEEDLAGWLLAGGTGEVWEHVSLPAIAEENDPLGRAVGEALWPEKHTIEDLRVMETASPYVFSGQYQQRPAPLGGGMFKPDRMGILDVVPKLLRKVRAWDLAATEDDGDWTAGLLLGEQENGRWLIMDVRRLRGAPDEVEEAIRATANTDGYSTRVALPQDPGQAGKTQISYYTKKLAGYRIHASPEWNSKTTRAEPFASQVNLSNVDMMRGDWNYALKHEMSNFPFGKTKDQVDAASRAFMVMTEKKRPFRPTQNMIQMAGIAPPRGRFMGMRV